MREQNEELNGQILSLSLHEAKNLFATQTKAQSLAAEIDSASRDEVCIGLMGWGGVGWWGGTMDRLGRGVYPEDCTVLLNLEWEVPQIFMQTV